MHIYFQRVTWFPVPEVTCDSSFFRFVLLTPAFSSHRSPFLAYKKTLEMEAWSLNGNQSLANL